MCLFLSSQGKIYIYIAKALETSHGTVKTYEKGVLKKLNSESMKQAVVIGLGYGDIVG